MIKKKSFSKKGIRLQVEVGKPIYTKVKSHLRIRLGRIEKVRAHFRCIGITNDLAIRIIIL